MNFRNWTSFVLGLSTIAVSMSHARGADQTPISWKKTVIEGKFRSEGVAIADVNKDGKLDVLIGDSWYEAPSWTKHDIRKPGDYGDGLHGYSECMTCWTDDINGDGWADQIVIGFPGMPAYWYENPKGKPGYWPEHRDLAQCLQRNAALCRPFRRRSSRAGDGLAAQGQGQRRPDGLVHARQGSRADRGRCTPSASRAGPGKPIPGTFRFSHGLGVGDMNGDGLAGCDLHRRLVGTARVGRPQEPARPGPSIPPTSAMRSRT